ncbi:unnamed protein product, partial [Adineta steineri]
VLQLRKDLKNNEDAIAARALLGMVATDIEHQKGAIEYDLNVAAQQFNLANPGRGEFTSKFN